MSACFALILEHVVALVPVPKSFLPYVVTEVGFSAGLSVHFMTPFHFAVPFGDNLIAECFFELLPLIALTFEWLETSGQCLLFHTTVVDLILINPSKFSINISLARAGLNFPSQILCVQNRKQDGKSSAAIRRT